ncbi:MAG: hypothetical protein MUF60_08975 [Vicinamibacterales bacterium]|jgi:hypothetical protein|nr:hypothetical protein [Vicinamibacterales bacterium]
MKGTGEHDTGLFPRGERDLAALAAAASFLRGVQRDQLRPGDTVVVETRNSLYAVAALGTGEFAVSGGWFEANQADGSNIAINGCTWGGRAILTDVIAAPGLFLEFGNGVRTTRIRAVSLVSGRQNAQLN